MHLADSLAALPLLDEALDERGARAGGRHRKRRRGAGHSAGVARPAARFDLRRGVAAQGRVPGARRGRPGARQCRRAARARRGGRPARGAGGYGVVVVRAVAPLATLVEYAAPLLAEGGRCWRGREPRGRTRRRPAAARHLELGLEPLEVRARDALPREPQPAPAPLPEGETPSAGVPAPGRAWHAGSRSARRRCPRVIGSAPNHDSCEAGLDGSAPNHACARSRLAGARRYDLGAGIFGPEAMATVYAVANQKGGVGKTTTAVNLAACVAEAGCRTLLVDLDPQCNATVALGMPKDVEPNTYSCLLGQAALADAARPSAIDSLSVVCLHSRPRRGDGRAAAARCLRAAPARRSSSRPRRTSTRSSWTARPRSGPLSVNALVAADRVLVPVQAEYLALEGLAQFLDTLSLIQRELNPRLEVAGMLLTMYDGRTRLAHDVEDGAAAPLPGPGAADRDPAQRADQRGAELRTAGDPPRPALRRLGRVLRSGEGGRRPWLSAASAAASRRSCPRRERGGDAPAAPARPGRRRTPISRAAPSTTPS